MQMRFVILSLLNEYDDEWVRLESVTSRSLVWPSVTIHRSSDYQPHNWTKPLPAEYRILLKQHGEKRTNSQVANWNAT